MDLKFVKQWLNDGNPPSKEDLKMRSTTVQRLVKHFGSLMIEPQYGAIAIKTAEFEHPEIDPISIIIPEHLEQEFIRKFHKSPQEGHFATAIIANKVLSHFLLSISITTVTRCITQCPECQWKKALFTRSNHKVLSCSQTNQLSNGFLIRRSLRKIS